MYLKVNKDYLSSGIQYLLQNMNYILVNRHIRYHTVFYVMKVVKLLANLMFMS